MWDVGVGRCKRTCTQREAVEQKGMRAERAAPVLITAMYESETRWRWMAMSCHVAHSSH